MTWCSCFRRSETVAIAGVGSAALRARRLLLGLALAVTGSLALPVGPVSADRLALLVAPSAIELRAAPGQEVVAELLVSNEGEVSYELSASLGRYGAGGRWSLEQLARLEPSALTLAPGELRTIELRLSLPADLPAGGRYAAIWIETRVGGSLVGIGRYAVPVLLTVDPGLGEASGTGVPGPTVPGPRLSLQRIMPMLDQHGQLLLSVEAANTGGVHCDPSGELELADSTGAVLARLPLALTESLLPATRQAALAGPLEVPTGRYRAHARLTCPDDAPAEASLQFSSEPRLELRRPDRLEASAEHLAVELLNRGEIAVEPLGSLFADDLQAGRVTRVDLEPRALLLPGASLVLEAEIPDGARSELAGLTALVLDGGGEPLVETIRPTAPLLGPAAPDDLLATRLGPATASGPTPFLLLPGLEIQLSGEQSTLLALALLAAGLCLLGLGLRAAERNAAERSRDPAESLTA